MSGLTADSQTPLASPGTSPLASPTTPPRSSSPKIAQQKTMRLLFKEAIGRISINIEISAKQAFEVNGSNTPCVILSKSTTSSIISCALQILTELNLNNCKEITKKENQITLFGILNRADETIKNYMDTPKNFKQLIVGSEYTIYAKDATADSAFKLSSLSDLKVTIIDQAELLEQTDSEDDQGSAPSSPSKAPKLPLPNKEETPNLQSQMPPLSPKKERKSEEKAPLIDTEEDPETICPQSTTPAPTAKESSKPTFLSIALLGLITGVAGGVLYYQKKMI